MYNSYIGANLKILFLFLNIPIYIKIFVEIAEKILIVTYKYLHNIIDLTKSL